MFFGNFTPAAPAARGARLPESRGSSGRTARIPFSAASLSKRMRGPALFAARKINKIADRFFGGIDESR